MVLAKKWLIKLLNDLLLSMKSNINVVVHIDNEKKKLGKEKTRSAEKRENQNSKN